MQLIPEQPQSFLYTPLTAQQQLEGQTLSYSQKLVVQNQRAVIAEQLLGLEFDTTNTTKFAQEQAFLQGQLVTFKWLLDASVAAEAALIDLASTSAEQDNQSPDQHTL